MNTTTFRIPAPPPRARRSRGFLHVAAASALLLALLPACAPAAGSQSPAGPSPSPSAPAQPTGAARAPTPDPRVGLRGGLLDAEEAIWNMRLLSETPSPEPFFGATNSDLAFLGNYAIQGNYRGIQFWDISTPSRPTLAKGLVCPASQNDVSVYRNLLFVSSEGLEGRVDCGTQAPSGRVSAERMRGVRIFDISDLQNPRIVANVQTCRGSHTHSLLVDPDDSQNVYVYVSGSYTVRSPEELPGCSNVSPSEDPNSALFRIEVIRVPLARPQDAAIVSSPRIFSELVEPPRHGETRADTAQIRAAEARGQFVAIIEGSMQILTNEEANGLLAQVVEARGGSGAPTAADSAALRQAIPGMVARMLADRAPQPGPDQCHDITLYPAIGLGGGACEGYGLLLDITNPTDPRRIDAVMDQNFSYWHSATFNNDGNKILFSDEWGGGVEAKCRASDPMEWGANAIFSIEQRRMRFRSYYKMPAPQTPQENCVAHNGSLIPIPGRDVMVQSWYQGGISVFDFTNADAPVEIAFFDRGPVNAQRGASGGSWSAYWYNGVIVSSEIARGLDILELTPSAFLTQNEINAAKTVRFDYLNVQGQQRFVWPASFALAHAYVDQLERVEGYAAEKIANAREELARAEGLSGPAQAELLRALSERLSGDVAAARDGARLALLAGTVEELGRAEGQRSLAGR